MSKGVKHLRLSNNGLHGKFLCRFLDATLNYKSLTSLDFSGNEFPFSVHFKDSIRKNIFILTYLKTEHYMMKVK